MKESNHSALPWSHYPTPGGDTFWIQDSAGMEFIEIDSTRTGNAADSGQFVLTACNAYDDLLAACKLALHNSERFGSGSDTEAETEGALRAAIAKAEQEEI